MRSPEVLSPEIDFIVKELGLPPETAREDAIRTVEGLAFAKSLATILPSSGEPLDQAVNILNSAKRDAERLGISQEEINEAETKGEVLAFTLPSDELRELTRA